MNELETRAKRLAALSDPVRLAIVDELSTADRSPVEIRQLFSLESNLLAHHLDVLDDAGLIMRSRSSGDGRRRYVHLLREALDGLMPQPQIESSEALFICTHNSARSQLAAAVWQQETGTSASSAGTHPADVVHPGAIAAAKRASLPLDGAIPRSLDGVKLPRLVITVCDRAHEELEHEDGWLHWSITDPSTDGSDEAFDAVVAELRDRMRSVISETPPK